MQTYKGTQVHTHRHPHTYMHGCMHTQPHTHSCMQAIMHTRMHIHTHICMHECTQSHTQAQTLGLCIYRWHCQYSDLQAFLSRTMSHTILIPLSQTFNQKTKFHTLQGNALWITDFYVRAQETALPWNTTPCLITFLQQQQNHSWRILKGLLYHHHALHNRPLRHANK